MEKFGLKIHIHSSTYIFLKHPFTTPRKRQFILNLESFIKGTEEFCAVSQMFLAFHPSGQSFDAVSRNLLKSLFQFEGQPIVLLTLLRPFWPSFSIFSLVPFSAPNISQASYILLSSCHSVLLYLSLELISGSRLQSQYLIHWLISISIIGISQ